MLPQTAPSATRAWSSGSSSCVTRRRPRWRSGPDGRTGRPPIPTRSRTWSAPSPRSRRPSSVPRCSGGPSPTTAASSCGASSRPSRSSDRSRPSSAPTCATAPTSRPRFPRARICPTTSPAIPWTSPSRSTSRGTTRCAFRASRRPTGCARWSPRQGGTWLADSPSSTAVVLDGLRATGVIDAIAGHLGETPVFSMQKSTLRRSLPKFNLVAWHQDGSFLDADVRTMNVWVALSPCGGDRPSPGLEILPRRLDEVLPVDGVMTQALGLLRPRRRARRRAADGDPRVRPGRRHHLRRAAPAPDAPRPRT